MPAISPVQISQFCDDYLSVREFSDYCPNGLQVDANTHITKIITGVTASQALIDQAVVERAQALLVHHGYFWKGESAALTGIKGTRIRTLMQQGISLIAYHLPLDAHPIIGNNAVLANVLQLDITGALYPHEKRPVGNIATCSPITVAAFADRITQTLGRMPLVIGDTECILRKIALCTGGAQDMIEQAYLMGADAYISGEASERTTHMARELGVVYFGAGHHATERGGIRMLGDVVATHFGIEVKFIDIDNPV